MLALFVTSLTLTAVFASNFSFSGRSHVSSLFTHEEQKKVNSPCTYAGRICDVTDTDARWQRLCFCVLKKTPIFNKQNEKSSENLLCVYFVSIGPFRFGFPLI